MHNPLTLIPAASVSLEKFASIYTEAFTGYLYPITETTSSLSRRIRLEQIDLQHSLIAYDENTLVGFAMLAIRGSSGWIGGFAITPQYRGQGYACELMRAIIKEAFQYDIEQLSLEVLTNNPIALHLYRKMGMHVVRDLHTLERPGYFPNHMRSAVIKEAEPTSLLRNFARLHPHPPAWKRALPSLLVTDGLRGIYLGDKANPDAYALLRKRSEDTYIADLAAVDTIHANLLCNVLTNIPGVLKVVNEPDESLFLNALIANKFVRKSRQHELLYKID